MIEVTGTIELITKENNNGRDKKVLSLQAGRSNLLFIEFQGKTMEQLKDHTEGDRVCIRIRFNGKVSKLGRKYNNIVAKSIKTI